MSDAATPSHAGRVHGINHVGLSVGDLAVARTFWCDALGFVEFGEFSWPAGTTPADEALGLRNSAAHVVLLRAGNIHLELFEFVEPTPTPQARTSVTDPFGRNRAGIAYLAIDSRDVGATVARLTAHDVNVAAGSDEGWLWVKDPDGNAVALLSGPTRSGRQVDAHPPRTEASAPPTPLRYDDVAGVDHIGVGLLGSPETVHHNVRGWHTITGSTDQPASDPPWVVPGSNVDLVLSGTSARGTDPASRRACDLGYNHLCLDVSGIESLRTGLAEDGTRWNHPITESSGGIAAVVYGRTPDGVLLELLENRTPETWMWCGHLAVQEPVSR